jgi:three-Cys-motif partner protein
VSQKQAARFTATWGDDSWRNIAYKQEQRSLLDEGGFIEEKASNEAIVSAFQARLRDVAGFRYVPNPIPMKNASRATVYYLFFASPNATGKKIVEHIFKKHATRASHGQ